ncbi:S-fimbrial protein subunit SfaG precursor [Serratia quinivorans]|uniref:fimbrial protein n=1 Tax=Serratia TaxID=613 RepID=UPI001F4BD7DE|nr:MULTISPECIES: fimbrial protein [Serratia]ULG13839.1 fimbrial protein [Serratia proteamaculans]ULG13981.1 fimbrial protein [Serratia proteamaculans]ULG14336.1 fimbrial protein [Serratia proteamaculans]ULG14960.1 fimbrial protein [Serratia proteamaculans]ULG15393.1 fimbrial protein [Serratia proteamaculans]
MVNQSRWTPIAMLLLLPSLMAQAATDRWNVDDENAVLHVHSAITESACRLDMTSAYQDVWLGSFGTARLKRAGDRGPPVAVQLKLHDCARSQGLRAGGVSQPAVSVSFVAQADDDNPQLVKVTGARGLGVRILDTLRKDIRLGNRSAPLFIMPGEDVLTYFVMPERTSSQLETGVYQANMDFRMNYD